MNKSLTIETFTLKETASGCKTVPARKEAHPLLSKLHGGSEKAVNATVRTHYSEVLQNILRIAPSLGVCVLEVREHENFAEFDVCTSEEWETANALDLRPVLASRGIELAATWLPDGRIVLPATPQGSQWSHFEPNASRTKEQNLLDVANYVVSLLPDPQNTFFNLRDFLGKTDSETPYEFGRGLYKYTDCGPWTAFKLASGSGRADNVYYEDKRASANEAEQDWWDQCIGVEIGSIVEGSDVEIEARYLPFPFTAKELDSAVAAIDDEADFYWKRDNTLYYSVLDAKGKLMLSCQWTDWADEPTGNFEALGKKKLALAIAARKALEDHAANTLAEANMRVIDFEHRTPIPGTQYFVREDETPDITY